ncbi:MAG: sugar nucleotide-binding protein [Alphaproteobacteria bacterium]|nr:sugar nucleotide-binding protein [Alphaproteobacteria bacterium]
MLRRVLIVGGDGKIATAVAHHLAAEGAEVIATTRRRERVSPTRPFLELPDLGPLRDLDPGDACLLSASVASPEAVRHDPEGVRRVNVEAITAAAEICRARRAHVLFLSTNQVFDGTVPRPPADRPTCPVSEYGRQKAEVEDRLRAMGQGVAILRLARALERGLPLFVEWKRRLLAGEPIEAFTERTIAPISYEFLAKVIGAILAVRGEGVWQVSGNQDLSYFEIAGMLAARLGADPALVRPTTAAEKGLLEPSPAHTTLDMGRLTTCLGFQAPFSRAVVEDVLEEL